jgi:endonuclease/exonuclease/phosphatase family metal-dependent hydrolase
LVDATSEEASALTVVSWNIKGAQRAEGWDRIEAKLVSLHADVALLQEAHPQALPEGSVCRDRGTQGRDGKHRPWATAIVPLTDRVSLKALDHAQGVWHGRPLELAPLACTGSGHASAALARTPVGDLTLISAYGLIEFGYASGTLLRMIADLEPLFDDPVHGSNLLIAGDWNIGTWWSGSDAKYAARESAILALLTSYGMDDLLHSHRDPALGALANCACRRDDCRHVWTYRKDSSDVAYQDDYAFASQSLAGRVQYAAVDPGWDWDLGLSDHAPLVIRIGPLTALG